MASFRQITVMGNVGKDPVIRKLESGATVASLSVAVSEKFTTKGEKREKTTWFDIDIWQTGDTGIITSLVGPHIRKGQSLLVQGTPEIQEYEKDGVKRRSFRIRVGGPGSTVRLCGSPKNGDAKEDDKTVMEVPPLSDSLASDDIPF